MVFCLCFYSWDINKIIVSRGVFRMAEHVDELVKELRRKNFQKKKALASGGGCVEKRPAGVRPQIEEKGTAADLPADRGFQDLHEVALRVRGKK